MSTNDAPSKIVISEWHMRKGFVVRVSLDPATSSNKPRAFIEIRVLANDAEGECKPTKNGVWLPARHLGQLIRALQGAEDHLARDLTDVDGERAA
jgi:hypothetical protein